MLEKAILENAKSYKTRKAAEKIVVGFMHEFEEQVRYIIIAQPDGRFTAAVISPENMNAWMHYTKNKVAVIG